jgi:membrane protein
VFNAIASLGQRTWQKFQADEGGNMAATLAYYALFSLFPLLLVTLSLLGYIAAPGSDVRADILRLAASSLPADAYTIVEDALTNLTANRGRVGIVGFVTLLLSASGFFGALDKSLDRVWGVRAPSQSGGFFASVLSTVRDKALAFALVFASVLLVLLSTIANLVIGALLSVASEYTGPAGLSWADVALAQAVQLGVSFVALMVVLALLYRMLPSTFVAWGDVWPAAALVALLFIMLQRLAVGGVVNLGSSYEGYGVIGGVMLLLFWLYLSLQLLLLGAEFSFAFAEHYGSRRASRNRSLSNTTPESTPEPQPATGQQREARERTAQAAGVGVLVGMIATAALSLTALVLGLARAARVLRRR